MNKDLIFVTSYCPNEEQVKRLRNNVNNLRQLSGFDIALCTHLPVPIDIQGKCDYYLYDSFNELSDNIQLKHFERHYQSSVDLQLNTKFLKKTPFYGYAIYRMFSLISKLAENFEYERIYHVEYDIIIKDLNIFLNQKKLLENYDSVFYNSEYEKNFILGGLKSFRVEKLPHLFKNYRPKEMEDIIVSEDLLPLEKFTYHIFSKSGNSIIINWDIIKDKIEPKKFKSQELNWCLYYNRVSDYIGFCYLNYFETCNLELIINKNKPINCTVDNDRNVWIELDIIDSIKHLTVRRDGTIIYDSEVSDMLKKDLKLYSYVDKP